MSLIIIKEEKNKICGVCGNNSAFICAFDDNPDIMFYCCNKCKDIVTPDTKMNLGCTEFGEKLIEFVTGFNFNKQFKDDNDNYLMKLFYIERELNPSSKPDIAFDITMIFKEIMEVNDGDYKAIYALMKCFAEIEELNEGTQKFMIRCAYASFKESLREFIKDTYNEIIEKWMSVIH